MRSQLRVDTFDARYGFLEESKGRDPNFCELEVHPSDALHLDGRTRHRQLRPRINWYAHDRHAGSEGNTGAPADLSAPLSSDTGLKGFAANLLDEISVLVFVVYLVEVAEPLETLLIRLDRF